MRIYLACDKACLTENKVRSGRLGGTERLFLLLEEYLKQTGINVERTPNPPKGEYDIVVHSNVYNPQPRARRHVLWCGSWHAQGKEHCDIVLTNSQYMKDRMNWPDAEVFPAPFNHIVLNYASSSYIPGRIVCTSNPNRYLSHMLRVLEKLKERGNKFEFCFTGGNKLYSDAFSEYVNFFGLGENIKYMGVLPREDIFRVVSGAHIWCYANLSDNSETECVSALEAIAMGIPTIVPKREPFTSIMPEAVLCANEDEFVDALEFYLVNREAWQGIPRIVEEYDDRVLMPKLVRRIEEIVEGK